MVDSWLYVDRLTYYHCVGTKLKFSEEAIATAQVFYHTFYSVMDQGDYETTVSPPSALGSFAADCYRNEQTSLP